MAVETHRAGLLKPSIVQLLHGRSLKENGEVGVEDKDRGGRKLSFTKSKSGSTRDDFVLMLPPCKFQPHDPQNFKDAETQSLL